MSQYTNARLLTDGDGNPIPQYLDVNDKTDSPQGTFKPLTGDPRQVQLTGRKVESLVVTDALAIRDTSKHDFLVDLSHLGGKKAFFVKSSLDQTVYTTLYAKGKSYDWCNIGDTLINYANEGKMFFFYELEAPLQMVRVRIYCDTAPTEGSVNIGFEGVEN